MNMKRFRQVLAYIEQHPEELDQGQPCSIALYGCGCFGAHVRKMFGTDDTQSPAYIAQPWEAIEEYLGADSRVALWLWAPERTLDDFRTFARRPYA